MKNLSKLISACNRIGIKTDVKKVTSRVDMRQYGRTSYLYVHVGDNGEVFYIGKGMHIRAFVSHGRSKYWRNKSKKIGLNIFIISHGLSENETLENEIKVIAEAKRLGFKLSNISDGGEGCSSYVCSQETRLKQSLAKKGKKMNPNFVKAGKTARLGMKNKPENIEKTAQARRKPVINSKGEIFNSATSAAKKYNGSQGLISNCARGCSPRAYGLTWSYDISIVPKLNPVSSSRKMVARSDGLIFESTIDATNFMSKELGRKCHNQRITESARSNGLKKAYGYNFYYDFNRETDKAKFEREHAGVLPRKAV